MSTMAASYQRAAVLLMPQRAETESQPVSSYNHDDYGNVEDHGMSSYKKPFLVVTCRPELTTEHYYQKIIIFIDNKAKEPLLRNTFTCYPQ